MLADLERGLEIVRGGHAVVPAWRVLAPDGDFGLALHIGAYATLL
jgi:hypothetical protein